MLNDAKEFFEDWKKAAAGISEQASAVNKGVGALFSKTMKEGELTVKEKEMIALGIGIALRCKPCIYLHVQKCLDAGASREQIIEAAGVAVMMQGGPGYTYLPVVIDALDALDA